MPHPVFRDAPEVLFRQWSSAPMAWPRARRPCGRHPAGPGGRGRSRVPRPAVVWRVVVGHTTLPSPRTAAGDDGRRVGRLGSTTPPAPAMGAPPGHEAAPTPPTPSVADG